jgi:uncharacterized protein
MNPRVLLPLLLLLLVAVTYSAAQQTSDPKQAELDAYAHFKALKQVELKELFSKADSGDAEAQYWIGCFYADRLCRESVEALRLGPKPPQEVRIAHEEAARWFLKSAEQGYMLAQRLYGLMSVHTNPAVAERWMLSAGLQGDAETQLWLGHAYEDNWFGTTDVEEALKWYKMAAEGGDPDAQVVLGQKYKDGEGIEQNYELAAKWFRKAAEHAPNWTGARQGKNRLGGLYMTGRGVPRDYVQAYFWFSLNGPEGDTPHAKIHLSAEQIEETDRLVKGL